MPLDLTSIKGIEEYISASKRWCDWLARCARIKQANKWDFINGPHWIIPPMLYTPAEWHRAKA